MRTLTLLILFSFLTIQATEATPDTTSLSQTDMVQTDTAQPATDITKESNQGKTFHHEIGFETSYQFEEENFWWGPIPFASLYYRYYFSAARPLQGFVTAGLEERIYTDGALLPYLEGGFRLTKYARWDPNFVLRNSVAFEVGVSDAFRGMEVALQANLLSYKTPKGNTISFANPRVSLLFFEYEFDYATGASIDPSPDEAILGISLISYGVRF